MAGRPKQTVFSRQGVKYLYKFVNIDKFYTWFDCLFKARGQQSDTQAEERLHAQLQPPEAHPQCVFLGGRDVCVCADPVTRPRSMQSDP